MFCWSHTRHPELEQFCSFLHFVTISNKQLFNDASTGGSNWNASLKTRAVSKGKQFVLGNLVVRISTVNWPGRRIQYWFLTSVFHIQGMLEANVMSKLILECRVWNLLPLPNNTSTGGSNWNASLKTRAVSKGKQFVLGNLVVRISTVNWPGRRIQYWFLTSVFHIQGMLEANVMSKLILECRVWNLLPLPNNITYSTTVF